MNADREARLKDEVIKICTEYLKLCQSRWFQIFHHDARTKMDLAISLRTSARDDDFTDFVSNINNALKVLDQGDHNFSRLRPILEECQSLIRRYAIIEYRR